MQRKLGAVACGIVLLSLVLSTASRAAEPALQRYTFSWPLDGSGPLPRGGTSKGAPVTMDREPSAAWKALQTSPLTPFERDRRAILAMAGAYRVTFDFLEVMTFGSAERPAPYQSWGTEKIYVDADDGKSISLVHILAMRIVNPDGSISEPLVTKHWRQDWVYEPSYIVEYRGRDQWQQRKLDAADAKHAWSQTVTQVDESPRYASLGRWQHAPGYSSWLSGETWRPLPRREWSVRDDYQVLMGTNRHTIVSTGWAQEENNLKVVLGADRTVDATQPYRGREYGLARYERIKDDDFATADEYFQKTKAFWDQVREQWSRLFASQGVVTLRGPVDKLGLFQPLFARADKIDAGESFSASENSQVIRDALKAMGAIP